MPKIKDVLITTDSTCDLPQKYVDEYNIKVIPLSILLGNNEYSDGVDIKPTDIYKHVENGGDLPKTAAVPPSKYYSIFSEAVKQGKKVVHIGLSSAISSTYQNACVAAAEFDDVYCVDSKSLCTAMGLLVLKACDFREKGYDAKKIHDKIEKLVPKVSTTFVLSIAVDNSTGALDVAKKYRGKMENVYKQYVTDCVKDVNKIDTSRIVIANSGNIKSATLAFAKGLIEGKNKFDQIIEADAGCTISSHCGPKTLAVFYIRK